MTSLHRQQFSTLGTPELDARGQAMRAGIDESVLNNPELAAQGEEAMSGLPERMRDYARQWSDLGPEDGSRFQVDDRAKPFDPPSDQVRSALLNAIDHLRVLSTASDEQGFPPAPSFTLMRVAVEASAVALWLMTPGTIDARIRRSIQLTWVQRQGVETFMKGVNAKAGAEMTELTRDTLLHHAGQRPGTRNINLDRKFPSLTTIIETVETREERRSYMRPVTSWRAGSGVAHSSESFIGGSRSIVDGPVGPVDVIRPVIVWVMLSPVEAMLQRALATADRYCRPTPGKGRPPRS